MRGNPTLVFQTAGQIETRFPAGNRDVNGKCRGQNMSICFSPHFMLHNLHNLLLDREPFLNKIGLFLTLRGGSGIEVSGRGPSRSPLLQRSGRLAVRNLGETQLQAVEGQAEK